MDECLTCRFWYPTAWSRVNPGEASVKDEPTHGECRLKAPVVVVRPHGKATVCPETAASFGCGDHAVRP